MPIKGHSIVEPSENVVYLYLKKYSCTDEAWKAPDKNVKKNLLTIVRNDKLFAACLWVVYSKKKTPRKLDGNWTE